MDKKLYKVLLKCGVQPHLLGFEYIGEAVKMVIEDREALTMVTKVLYPGIARKFNTTPSRVERAIRHACEQAFNIMTLDMIYEVFGNTLDPYRGKATNSHFIAAVAGLYRQECSVVARRVRRS